MCKGNIRALVRGMWQTTYFRLYTQWRVPGRTKIKVLEKSLKKKKKQDICQGSISYLYLGTCSMPGSSSLQQPCFWKVVCKSKYNTSNLIVAAAESSLTKQTLRWRFFFFFFFFLMERKKAGKWIISKNIYCMLTPSR